MARYEENEKNPIYKKWWFWLIIIVVIIIIATSQGGGNTGETTKTSSDSASVQKSEKTEELMEVDYNVLFQDYQDNAIGADAKYKDKMLKLTGKVDEINREIAGNPYITFHIGEQYSFKDIRITLKKSEEAKIANLTKNQLVTIKGKCSGLLLTSTVSLKDCEIIE